MHTGRETGAKRLSTHKLAGCSSLGIVVPHRSQRVRCVSYGRVIELVLWTGAHSNSSSGSEATRELSSGARANVAQLPTGQLRMRMWIRRVASVVLRRASCSGARRIVPAMAIHAHAATALARLLPHRPVRVAVRAVRSDFAADCASSICAESASPSCVSSLLCSVALRCALRLRRRVD